MEIVKLYCVQVKKQLNMNMAFDSGSSVICHVYEIRYIASIPATFWCYLVHLH